MHSKISKNHVLLLSFYIIINTFAFFWFLNEMYIYGDFPQRIHVISYIYISFILVIFPFIFFNGFLYDYFKKYFRRNSAKTEDKKNRIGIFVILLQIGFLLFNLIYGVNVAASEVKTDSLLKYIFIIFNPDMLFLIYYGVAKNSKLYKYNLMIYILSNLQRGWLGGMLFILFLEISIAIINKKKNIILVTIFLIVILTLISPILIALKWTIRFYYNFGDSVDAFVFFQNLNSIEAYFNSVFTAIEYLIGRFQTISNVYLLLEHMDKINSAREMGDYVCSLCTGLPQMLVYKLFGLDYVTLHSYVVSVFDISYQDVNWNVNTSWAGWLIADIYLSPLFVIYTMFLILISVKLTSMINGRYSHEVSWLVLLIYLQQGWIATYIIYILSLFIFLFFIKKIKY